MLEPGWASTRDLAQGEAAVGAQHVFGGADVRQLEFLIWEDFLKGEGLSC